MVFVPDVVCPGEDDCMGILEQMAAEQAEDNHYQGEGAEDIHKLEAVGKGNWVQGLNNMHDCFLPSYYQDVLKNMLEWSQSLMATMHNTCYSCIHLYFDVTGEITISWYKSPT